MTKRDGEREKESRKTWKVDTKKAMLGDWLTREEVGHNKLKYCLQTRITTITSTKTRSKG